MELILALVAGAVMIVIMSVMCAFFSYNDDTWCENFLEALKLVTVAVVGLALTLFALGLCVYGVSQAFS